jgi:hypothetical protein
MVMIPGPSTARNIKVRRLNRESLWMVLLIQKEGEPQSCGTGGVEEVG